MSTDKPADQPTPAKTKWQSELMPVTKALEGIDAEFKFVMPSIDAPIQDWCELAKRTYNNADTRYRHMTYSACIDGCVQWVITMKFMNRRLEIKEQKLPIGTLKQEGSRKKFLKDNHMVESTVDTHIAVWLLYLEDHRILEWKIGDIRKLANKIKKLLKETPTLDKSTVTKEVIAESRVEQLKKVYGKYQYIYKGDTPKIYNTRGQGALKGDPDSIFDDTADIHSVELKPDDVVWFQPRDPGDMPDIPTPKISHKIFAILSSDKKIILKFNVPNNEVKEFVEKPKPEFHESPL